VLLERANNGCAAAVSGEIRVFAKCRNERLRLPAFLKHYRHLGVDRFFIVDNGSSDGTIEYLAAEPDVQLFRTAGRFREARGGTDWLNALLAAFGAGAWCVTVDIDELLVYPGSERAPLRSFTDYLHRGGYQAVACLLLDLYPSGPLKAGVYTAGEELLAAAPYFDAGPYKVSPYMLCPNFVVTGGMRERVFFREPATSVGSKIRHGLINVMHRTPVLRETPWARAARQRSPCLTKVPLVRWDEQTRYIYCTHFLSPKVMAPDTGVLLHFKFLHDFHARSSQEAARGEYHDSAAEYVRYARAFETDPDMRLDFEGSARFESSTQLVQLGLMRDTKEWTNARAK
jgi:hypothetical protein